MIDGIRTTTATTLVLFLSCGLLALGGCDDSDPTLPPPGETIAENFAFEDGMEGWYAVATDTLSPPIEWHVEHTAEPSHTGAGAVELFLANYNDAGKIWMERPFDLEAGTTYEVEVDYAFGTTDWGDVNLFTIIAGVHSSPPREAEDLSFQGDTGHGQSQDAGLVWLDKSYSFTATASGAGTLYVALGVWGTWETPRTYFVDDVTVRFTPVG